MFALAQLESKNSKLYVANNGTDRYNKDLWLLNQIMWTGHLYIGRDRQLLVWGKIPEAKAFACGFGYRKPMVFSLNIDCDALLRVNGRINYIGVNLGFYLTQSPILSKMTK